MRTKRLGRTELEPLARDFGGEGYYRPALEPR